MLRIILIAGLFAVPLQAHLEMGSGALVMTPSSGQSCYVAYRRLLDGDFSSLPVANRAPFFSRLWRRLRGGEKDEMATRIDALARLEELDSIRNGTHLRDEKYHRATEQIIRELARFFGDDAFLVGYMRGELERVRKEHEYWEPEKVEALTRLIDATDAKQKARQALETAVDGQRMTWQQLVPAVRARAEGLARGFSPEAHLAEGVFRPEAVEPFLAGEIFHHLRARGETLSPEAAALADAYVKTTAALREKPTVFAAKGLDFQDTAVALRAIGVGFTDEAGGRITLPPTTTPDHALDRVRFLLQRAAALPSKEQAIFVSTHTADLQRDRAHRIFLRDQAWGFFERSLYDLVNERRRFRFMHNSYNRATDRAYRSHVFEPQDLADGPSKNRVPGLNGAGNWMLAGFVPKGKSGSPNKDHARILYWDGDAGDGYRTMGNGARVAENWREVRPGKWELESIEFMVRTEGDTWVPFFFVKDKEKGTFEPKEAKNCTTCHALKGAIAATFGPRPKTTALPQPNPFRTPHSEYFADRIARRQADPDRN